MGTNNQKCPTYFAISLISTYIGSTSGLEYTYYSLVIFEIQVFYTENTNPKGPVFANGVDPAASVAYAIQGVNPMTMLQNVRIPLNTLTLRS